MQTFLQYFWSMILSIIVSFFIATVIVAFFPRIPAEGLAVIAAIVYVPIFSFLKTEVLIDK